MHASIPVPVTLFRSSDYTSLRAQPDHKEHVASNVTLAALALIVVLKRAHPLSRMTGPYTASDQRQPVAQLVILPRTASCKTLVCLPGINDASAPRRASTTSEPSR